MPLHGGDKKRRLYTARWNDEARTELAWVLVINGEPVGRFERKTEYWYVNGAGLSLLGTQGSVLEFGHEDDDGAPDELPTGWQEFTWRKDVDWTVDGQSFRDPYSGGVVYVQGNGMGSSLTNLNLRIVTQGSQVKRLTWYQQTFGGMENLVAAAGRFPWLTTGFVTRPFGGKLGYVSLTLAVG
jgi:hypothetical protein